MCVYSRKRRDLNFKVASIVILVNLVLCSVISCLYKYNTDELIMNYDNNIEARKIAEWDSIELYIKVLYNGLDNSINDIANNVEEGIREEYPDLEVLKEEMESANYSHLDKTVAPFIKDVFLTNVENDRNDIFVAVNDGIISNFSLSDVPYEYEYKNNNIFKWSDYIERSFNKTLTKDSVDMILNQSNDIIFSENKNTLIIDHEKILQPYLSEMKKVYLKEGLDGLRNYTFLVPAYITNDGDIFGQNDIINGYRYSTYKIILIQEFNIYDQLMTNYPTLINEERYHIIDNNMMAKISGTSLVGMLIMLEMFACIVLSCLLFNMNLINYKSSLKEKGDNRKESN